MIEYLYVKGKEQGDREYPVPVKLDGKVVGIIRPVYEGWQYISNGRMEGGEIFKTIQEVQNNLEEE